MSKYDNPISIIELLNENLSIPYYQRPYKWSEKNILVLLEDIKIAIEDSKKYNNFKYRIGTIILCQNEKNENILDIVDGQQRIISLVLIIKYLANKLQKEGIIEKFSILKHEFKDKTTQDMIYNNYNVIKNYFEFNNNSGYEEEVLEAMEKILEVIVIKVKNTSEAFQLFDSQNSRGKELYPHDLLKAYHLRSMKKQNSEKMREVVERWEMENAVTIKNIFSDYLFPIYNWTKRIKTKPFTTKDIDIYKGVPKDAQYNYMQRLKEQEYFQISEPFFEGEDFFNMVEHYIEMKNKIQKEINENSEFKEIKDVLESNTKNGKDNEEDYKKTGFIYARDLFYCAVMCYYDKFKNFNSNVIKKIYTWAFMLRVDMERLGYASINRYAIEEESKDANQNYSNHIPMFFKIAQARLDSQIENISINIDVEKLGNLKGKKENV